MQVKAMLRIYTVVHSRRFFAERSGRAERLLCMKGYPSKSIHSGTVFCVHDRCGHKKQKSQESESVKKEDARFLSFVQQQKIIVKKGRKSLEQHGVKVK